MLVRHGKGGKRREVGMDDWGWQQLDPWLKFRMELPVGALFCVISGPTAGRPWSAAAARTQFRRLALRAGVRRRFDSGEIVDVVHARRSPVIPAAVALGP